MRIALVHTRLVRRGGLETRLVSYMAALSARGHDVTVVVGEADPAIALPHGVRLVRLNLKPVIKHFRGLVFDRLLGPVVAAGGFDYVVSLARTSHQHALVAPGDHIGFMRAKGKRFGNPSDYLKIHLDRRSFAASATILAASAMIRREAIELYGVDPGKIRVLHPPLDTSRFRRELRADRQALRRRHGFRDGRRVCLFVSGAHRRKGLPLLLEVFRRLRGMPVQLCVAGIKPPATELPNVRYLGFSRAPEELYAAADLTLLPAVYEPFGQVVAESISCGTPVLISDRVGAGEIVSPGDGLILASFDPDDWAGAILALLAEPCEPPPDFAARHRIGLDDHIETILACAPGAETAPIC